MAPPPTPPMILLYSRGRAFKRFAEVDEFDRRLIVGRIIFFGLGCKYSHFVATTIHTKHRFCPILLIMLPSRQVFVSQNLYFIFSSFTYVLNISICSCSVPWYSKIQSSHC